MDERERANESNEPRLIVADIVARTGIDEAMIERLVRAFYARARHDPLVGPVFASKVSDWEGHIEKMCAFWSSVGLMSGRYHGQPMVAHLPLPIDTPHFDRWLEIFADTAQEVCPAPAAMHFSTSPIASPTAWNWASPPRRVGFERNARDRRKPSAAQ